MKKNITTQYATIQAVLDKESSQSSLFNFLSKSIDLENLVTAVLAKTAKIQATNARIPALIKFIK
jgi:acetolactate synthase regulatory subunit